MMDDQTLRKVQLTQLALLRDFDALCKKHDISYILSSGTLLGAVRHQGFIPWDDDVDIDMTRENYDRFLSCADELDAGICIQNWHTDTEFALPFSKLRNTATVFRERASVSMKNCGIYIDIFPCDKRLTETDEKFRFLRLNLYRLLLLYLSPAYDNNNWKRRLRCFLWVCALFFRGKNGRKRLIACYEKLAKKQNGTDRPYRYFENGGARVIGQWIIEKDCLEQTCELPFEGEKYPCPKDYDMYLRTVYGDYMQLPPEEKRYNRHEIIEISFGGEDA